jgi:F-box protein 39
VWRNFEFDDETLSKPKYNLYSGFTYHLDHNRTRSFLTKIGGLLKGLDFQPKHNFNNFFQFVSILSWCMEEVCVNLLQKKFIWLYFFLYFQSRKDNAPDDLKGIGNRLRTLNYIFPCNMAAAEEDLDNVKLYGTGGEKSDVFENIFLLILLLTTHI